MPDSCHRDFVFCCKKKGTNLHVNCVFSAQTKEQLFKRVVCFLKQAAEKLNYVWFICSTEGKKCQNWMMPKQEFKNLKDFKLYLIIQCM